jgi:hypothetical protein
VDTIIVIAIVFAMGMGITYNVVRKLPMKRGAIVAGIIRVRMTGRL